MKDKRSIIFLHFINRELHEALQSKVDYGVIYAWIEALVLTQTASLTCNIAQVYEFLHSAPAVIQLIAELVDADAMVTMSQVQTPREFKETRRAMYTFDKDRYPMYFDTLITDADAVAIRKAKAQETTSHLQRDIMSWDEGDLVSPGNIVLSALDRKIISPKIDLIRKVTMDRGNNAITPALYKRSLSERDIGTRELGVLPRLVTGLYVSHYVHTLNAVIPSGARGIEVNELENGYPDVDLELITFVLKSIGLYEQRFRLERNYRKQLSACYMGAYHVAISQIIRSMLKAADSLFDDDLPRFARRNQIKAFLTPYLAQHRIRNQVLSLGDFLGYMKRALERTASVISNEDSAFAKVYGEIGSSKGMQHRVLIHTATDTEDDALNTVLNENNIKPNNFYQISSVMVTEYEHPNGIILFHARTSMGMLGPSSAGYILKAVVTGVKADHIISAGLCFGLDREGQSLCDVVFSEEIQDYVTGKETDAGFESRGGRVPADIFLLSLARAARQGFASCKVKGGLYLSAPIVVNSQTAVDELRSRYPDAKAGDMEASAVFSAATGAGVGMITVKGICDWGAGKTDKVQDKAAENAFRFVFRMFELAGKIEVHTNG